MSKRKKPAVYLTPENRAYYETQMQHYHDFAKAMSERSPVNDQCRMRKFVDRVSVSEFMYAIWYRYPAATSSHTYVTHSSTMVVALAKGVSSRLQDVMQAVADGLVSSQMRLYAAAIGSKVAVQATESMELRTALSALTPAPPGIAELDVIFNREKYFAIDSLSLELLLHKDFDGDMFQRLMEFDRVWERVTQALEFVIESLEYERRQPQPCN